MMEMDIPETGRSLSEKLLGDRSEISYREIQQAVLPSFVKAWFHLGVETWYAPEYHQRTSSIRFDYKDETVQTLLKTFDDAVKQTALFSAEECRQIIETALRHEIAYANHSIGAFSDLMFQRSAVVDGFHVVDLLAHFQREHFFTEAVKSYVVEHDDTRMDRDILEHFLSGAQQEAYAKEPIAPLRDSVAAVSEILGLVDGNGHTGAFHPATWEKFVETRALEETLPVLPLAIERQKAIADVFDLATLEAA
ncbi:MAG: hypothetical protein FJY97_21495, partial [candidate division Zixibacteria bacterium]|nr:hypothetical protein [candidate division Zixibacteria bacterium]